MRNHSGSFSGDKPLKKKSRRASKKDLLTGGEIGATLDPTLSDDSRDSSEEAYGHDLELLPHVNLDDDSARDWYRKVSGMHTVSAWCQNYKKHPAGWGALVMIHGVNEISGRLRSKVENYAVYSAVLLSGSLPLLATPAEQGTKFAEAHWLPRKVFLVSPLGAWRFH